jgi:hypothetical protein
MGIKDNGIDTGLRIVWGPGEELGFGAELGTGGKGTGGVGDSITIIIGGRHIKLKQLAFEGRLDPKSSLFNLDSCWSLSHI